MSNRNREAGHNWEREVVRDLKEMGYKATTARYSSREVDDSKVDICGVPWNIQCKVSTKGVPYTSIIASMPEGDNVVANKIIKNKKTLGKYVIIGYLEWLKLLESQR